MSKGKSILSAFLKNEREFNTPKKKKLSDIEVHCQVSIWQKFGFTKVNGFLPESKVCWTEEIEIWKICFITREKILSKIISLSKCDQIVIETQIYSLSEHSS